MKNLMTLFTLTLLVAGCTKKLNYKEQYKEDVVSKANIDTSSEYLYVPSMASASRTSKVARPFWMGQEKRVKFLFTDKALQVLEIESDSRFSSNNSNSKLVLEIPVTHLQFQCAKDKYGECKNEEEENKEISWSQKAQFKPDFSGVRLTEVSLLAMQMDSLLGQSCYTEVGSRPLNFEITDTTVNFKIERSYKVDAKCLGLNNIESLADLNSTAVYHYSFAKINSLATKNYKVASYPREDQNTFGFFDTRLKQLDIDNNQTSESEKVLMNRWNPTRSEVVYYLSDEFAKPEHKSIREATFDAFAKVNRGLKDAGAQFQLNLKDGLGKEPGDIRNSMIVMVEDPVASSIIGYGPSIADPRTGEILGARVVMYLGTIQRYIKNSYDEVRRHHLAQKIKAPKVETLPPAPPAKDQPTPTAKALSFTQEAPVHLLANVKNELRNYTKNVSNSQSNPDIYLAQHNACALSGEMSSINTTIDKNLTLAFGQNLKSWEELTESEKQKAIQIILPETWSVTLVHELGHNLGLRHNFGGSEDKENFYTTEELQKIGLNHKVNYSSVMDYGSSELSVLPILGKYDIAALKYAYAGQVETKSGVISVKTTIADLKKEKVELKTYRYCSDEHVDVNAGCKKFDQGSSLTEIAQSLIELYETNYLRRNFRNKAYNFGHNGDKGYATRIESTFRNLRMFFETYERIVSIYPLTMKDWETEAFLKDLKVAASLSGQFLLQVILTPDIQCAVSATSKPSEIIGIQALSAIDKEVINCSDVSLKSEYMIVGQAGKSFSSIKSKLSTNPYMDQIDVRGIWIDKVLAIKYLLSRTMGMTEDKENFSFDKIKMNYFDIPDLQKPMMEAMKSILLNTSGRSIKFQSPSGQSISIPTYYDLFESQLITKTMDVKVMTDLGLPHRDQYLQEVLLQAINVGTPENPAEREQNRPMIENLGVFKTKKIFGLGKPPKGTVSTTIGDDVYAATGKNQMAANIIQFFEISKIISAISPKQLMEILKLKSTGAPLSEKATAAEKKAMALDKGFLEMAARGQLSPPSFYEKMITLLPVL